MMIMKAGYDLHMNSLKNNIFFLSKQINIKNDNVH